MYTPPKLKYSPEKLYKSDINDLVEDDVVKGGPGSGVKGHKTTTSDKINGDIKNWHTQEEHRHAITTGDRYHLNGLKAKYEDHIKTAKKRKDSHSEEKFSKLHSEVMTRLTKTA